ncbi:MAG: hypothetical protein V7776_10475 [Halopseudomonas aestusnigri]
MMYVYRIYKAIMYCIYWGRARSFALEKKFQDALTSLNKCDQHNENHPDYFMMRAFLLIRLNQIEDAKEASRLGFLAISSAKKINKCDEKYMLAYLAELENRMDGLSLEKNPFLKSKNFDVGKVSRHLTKTFPITIK